jgi:hypothetical protein
MVFCVHTWEVAVEPDDEDDTVALDAFELLDEVESVGEVGHADALERLKNVEMNDGMVMARAW